MTASAGSPPRLRLVPAPQIDPPFDDEAVAMPPAVAGTLALAFPAAARDSVPLRLLPPADPPADRTTPLPEPRMWAQRLVQAIVEVLAGARAPGQLAAHATLRVLDQLEATSGALGHPGRRAPALRPVVRSVHAFRPSAVAVEVCAVVDTGVRSRALALRLDGSGGRWRCTELELG
jgi:hypothetical protein